MPLLPLVIFGVLGYTALGVGFAKLFALMWAEGGGVKLARSEGRWIAFGSVFWPIAAAMTLVIVVICLAGFGISMLGEKYVDFLGAEKNPEDS